MNCGTITSHSETLFNDLRDAHISHKQLNYYSVKTLFPSLPLSSFK